MVRESPGKKKVEVGRWVGEREREREGERSIKKPGQMAFMH